MNDRRGGESLPWWPAPRARPAREPLSLEEIVQAALRVIDAESLEALSMRRLGQELGSGATSLYWHVKNKEQLLDLVTDAIIGEVSVADDPALSWRDRVARSARGMRDALRRHPNAAALPAFRVSMGPNAIRATEDLLGVFRSGGFEGVELWNAYQSVLTLVLGYAILETGAARGSLSGAAGAEASSAAIALLESLPPDRYPNLGAIVRDPALRDPAGGSFDYALERLLDGIEAERRRRGGAGSAG